MTDTGHQPHLPNARQRQTFAVTLLSLVITVAAVVGIVLVTSRRAEGEIRPPEEFAEHITEYDNGDFTYAFPEEDIRFDESELVLYANSTLFVCCREDLSAREKNALANEVGGTIVGHLDGSMPILQIHVDPFDLDGLEELSQRLMGTGNVLYATYEMPLSFEAEAVEDTNEWVENSAPNEDDPSGNNWWAEAIGCYSAWEHESLFGEATVGILDTGFDLDHPDLIGVMDMMPGMPDNVEDDHGTAVASVIGAIDNNEGLRGVASGADESGRLQMRGIDIDSPSIKSRGGFCEALRQFVQEDHGSKSPLHVINSSGGVVGVEELSDEGLEALFGRSFLLSDEQKLLAQGHFAKESSNTTMIAMMKLLHEAKHGPAAPESGEFLFVQSAGNALYDGKPLEAWRNGFAAGIDEELYDEFVRMSGNPGITFDELHAHTLVVGATQQRGDDERHLSDSDYSLSSSSCYGEEWVDICAPGKPIFAATLAGEKAYREDWSGTSFSAPMVSGAAALLWAMNPELTAAEVRSLILNNTSGTATPATDYQYGRYPILNVGLAVEDLAKATSRENAVHACSVLVRDALSDAPVEGAIASFEETGGGLSETLETDATGFVILKTGEPTSFEVTISADGYQPQTLSLPTSDHALELDGEINAATKVILLVPEEAERGDPSELLERIIEGSGQDVLQTGAWEFDRPDQVKSGWTLVPEERLDGLLLADLFDYDSDDQPELLAVSVRPRDGWAAPERNMAGWSEAEVTISVYEVAASTPNLADEITLVVPGLPDEHPETSVHVFRGSRQGCLVYLDVYGAINDQWMATLGVRYTSDGSLVVEGGGLLYEHYNDVLCLAAMAGEGAPALFNAAPYNEPWDGWTELCHLSWGDDPTPGGSFFDEYAEAYEVALGSVGLAPGTARSGFAGSTDELARTREKCAMRPSATLGLTTGGEIVELGGIVSRTQEDTRGIELTVYDETGLLDSWR